MLDLIVFWGIATVSILGVGFFVMAILKSGARADEHMMRLFEERDEA